MVSKLNSDRKAGEGAGQAIGRIYGKIGFGGLWNGLPVRIFMIGTLTAFQWLIYDSFKVYLGVSCSARHVQRLCANCLLATHYWWSLMTSQNNSYAYGVLGAREEQVLPNDVNYLHQFLPCVKGYTGHCFR